MAWAVAGALAVIRYAKIHGTKHRPWLEFGRLNYRQVGGLFAETR
jgi:hypothetical protein